MIHLRDNARIVGHPNIIHWFSTMSRPGETGNSLAFTALSGGLIPARTLSQEPVCSTIALILTNMPSSAAQLREKLDTRAAIGTFVKLGRREVIEILALAGLDFAICDLEHSQITEQEAGNLITAGRACALPVIVRVAHFDPGQINRLLEAGAAGIQLPQLQTTEQASAFRSACKYPPEGSRSLSLAQPAASYGSEPLTEYIQRSNREVLLVGQLESKDLERPLSALVTGLDIAFIGSLDLTVDMGAPGKLDDPGVQQRISEIEEAAGAANVHLGIYADSPARAAQAAAAGYHMIALSSDLGALAGSVKGWIKQLAEISATAAHKA
jgi:2-keto-3-deoxy-L-rhamnonate aldolase RhmA